MDTPLFVPVEPTPDPPPGGWTLKDAQARDIAPGSLIFFDNKTDPATELLKIGPEGFWVRGVKVEQGPGEAHEVYNGIRQLLGLEPQP
jgi:hypothetical protein